MIPTAAVLTTPPFLPDEIPANYDFNINIDCWGSKYESLVFPATTILMAVFLIVGSVVGSKIISGKILKK